MARSRKEDVKSKGERQQVILRLVQEHPISRQEVLLDHLSKEGFEVTQATVSRDIRPIVYHHPLRSGSKPLILSSISK